MSTGQSTNRERHEVMMVNDIEALGSEVRKILFAVWDWAGLGV